MARFLATLGPLLGRVLLAAIFVFSGYQKLFGATGRAASSIAGKGIPFATVAAYAAGTFELVLALLLVLGLKARLAALAGVVYLLVVTWFFHWRPALRGDLAQMIHLLKNLGLAGGMLLLTSHGPGPASIDRG
jgi:putative oxidoreductase